MSELVYILAAGDRDALGTVRTLAGLRAAEDASGIWLRGIDADRVPPAIESLPALHRYIMDESLKLFPLHKATPVGLLPTLTWQALVSFLPLSLPASSLPGSKVKPHTPLLVPTDIAKAPAALLTTRAHWIAYVANAPAVRLGRLQFAVSQTGSVLVMGDPLPPIPGEEFWQQKNLLIPAGYDFDPPMAGVLASDVLYREKDCFLLFGKDGGWQRVSSAYMIPVNRSTVRSLAEGGAHG